jgi:aspartyl-tRNA(Asn)/glutamyl-tRNA(Gln) amidotransferase subunit A
MASVDIEAGLAAAFAAFRARIADRGVVLHPVSVPGWEPDRLRRAGLPVSEAEGAAVLGADLDRGGPGFSGEFRNLLTFGRRADPARIAAARELIRSKEDAVAEALDGVDARVMPTAPQRPFPHGAAVPANQADLTALANRARVPAVAFPIPAADGAFPASAQLVGPPGSEERLIDLAEALLAP